MNNGLMRWVMSMGLVGTTILGAIAPALALTQAEIEERLAAIPVFTVTDENGSPLVARVENQLFAGVFIDPDDAEAFRQRVISGDGNFNGTAQVLPVSMDKIYNIERQRMANGQNRQPSQDDVDFVYIPAQEEVALAQELLPANQELQGVPLFAVRVVDPNRPANSNGDNRVHLTLEQQNGSGPIVPFYFSKQQAEALAQRYRETASLPANSDQVTIEVSTLELVLANWERSNQPGLQLIVLVPSEEARAAVSQDSGN